MKFSIKKYKENINNWLKREGFATPLKPRYILAFCSCVIIISLIPLLTAYFAISGLLEAKYIYGDEAEIPTSDLFFTALLVILSIAAIIISAIKMAVTLKKVYKKRKRKSKKKQGTNNTKQ